MSVLSDSELFTASISLLRKTIAAAGLDDDDCIERHELAARAAEASKLLTAGAPRQRQRNVVSTPPHRIHDRLDLIGVEHPKFNDFARASQVVRLRQLLTPSEIEAVHTLAASMEVHTVNASGKGNWQTTYLSHHGRFAAALPALQAKLVDAARRVDDEAGWSLLRGVKTLGIRLAEYHRVGVQGGLPWIHHRDWGSLITIDVMLSPRANFDGGTFQTSRVDGSLERAHEPFDRGDALVFVSHKPHHVAPVTRGERTVLVLELWAGEDRPCPRRCNVACGPCTCEYDHEMDQHAVEQP